MAEGTYEYECMRAELLGIEKPEYEEFMKKKRNEKNEVEEEEEEQEIENLKEVEEQSEQMTHITGGLDELNSILQVTQRKIHKFKASCGSLTSLLRFKIGASTSGSTESVENSVKDETNAEEQGQVEPVISCSNGAHKSDLAKALDRHQDNLDAMIEKAENAQYSMAHQTNEMKKFLK